MRVYLSQDQKKMLLLHLIQLLEKMFMVKNEFLLKVLPVQMEIQQN